jgi:biotin carboxyl carrier protein
MKITFDLKSLEINPSGHGYSASIDDKTVSIQVLHTEDGRIDLLVDGQRLVARVSSDGAKRWVTIDGHTTVLTKTSGARKGPRGEHAGGLAAPMPGVVRSVSVDVGEAVHKGQTLLIIEAMKMEIRIQAPKDGRVKMLHVKQGQTVEREQILIEVQD